MTFTKEDKLRLDQLLIELTFANESLEGKFGANRITPYDAINNLNISTLEQLHQGAEKMAKSYENKSRWKDNVDSRAKSRLSKWVEFLDLTIGYKYDLENQENVARERQQLLAELNELETSTKTPEQRIAELKSKLGL